MDNFKLHEARDRIDQLDQQIIALLAERFQVTEEVGHYKARNKLQAQDQARESLQFARIMQLSEQHGLKADYSSDIYRRIMDIVISRHEELQKNQSDAYNIPLNVEECMP